MILYVSCWKQGKLNGQHFENRMQYMLRSKTHDLFQQSKVWGRSKGFHHIWREWESIWLHFKSDFFISQMFSHAAHIVLNALYFLYYLNNAHATAFQFMASANLSQFLYARIQTHSSEDAPFSENNYQTLFWEIWSHQRLGSLIEVFCRLSQWSGSPIGKKAFLILDNTAVIIWTAEMIPKWQRIIPITNHKSLEKQLPSKIFFRWNF